MMVTPDMLLHTALGDDGETPFLFAVDKATGKRLGGIETSGLGLYGIMSYMNEGSAAHRPTDTGGAGGAHPAVEVTQAVLERTVR